MITFREGTVLGQLCAKIGTTQPLPSLPLFPSEKPFFCTVTAVVVDLPYLEPMVVLLDGYFTFFVKPTYGCRLYAGHAGNRPDW
jgi:hypothetical protein